MSNGLKDLVIFYGCIILMIVILVFTISAIMAGNEQMVEITIKDKWIKATGSGSDYMVSDTNSSVYKIDDSLWLRSFDASNRYAGIDINRTYGITTIGWRIPKLSMYTNIVEINYGVVEYEK